MTLAKQKPFSDVLISIEVKLVLLGWLTIARVGQRRSLTVNEPRVINWATASCLKAGVSQKFLTQVMERTPPDKQWYILRCHLPEAAFYILDGKLDAFLLSSDENQDSET